MGLLAALVALLCIYAPGTSSSFTHIIRKAVFSDNHSRSLWNCLQCVELKDAMVLNTWRTGRRFSVTVDCWWSSAVVLATSSMDTKPTAVCLDTGPGTPQCVLVRSFIHEHVTYCKPFCFRIASSVFVSRSIQRMLALLSQLMLEYFWVCVYSSERGRVDGKWRWGNNKGPRSALKF